MTNNLNPVTRRLFSIQESAQALGVSPRTIRYLLQGNKLESRMIGHRRLVTAESIDRLAQTGTEGQSAFELANAAA